ncbi:TraB/GumN family protein [Rhodocytophaga rosea]|uniref:TraB/GumN family protein n=1 Tax=Rhodocytophaga rosea TaxID=2704465 RepID=A0A6C0GEC1_9BACT|nr:TraB/GumN family protein [Rhodocytophaga rosea]QHT66257.1 TraB/GumN family protein [Rhodocytophaga rosea]
MYRSFTYCFTIICICFFSIQAFSQQSRSNYNLLWKISGNGLKKPSYLFGTMHLKDKRVFDFSDSVLVKLDECPAFAMEILPDSIIRALFTRFLSTDTTDKLRQMLTSEEYELLDKRLQDEAGLSIGKLKSKQPWLINMILDKTVVVPRKGDKTTFLDAYLYRLARQQDKKLIGLEKLQDQTSPFDDYASLKEQVKTMRTKLDKSYEAKFLENMIKMYHSGDVDKLYATIYPNSTFDQRRYKVLTVRNIAMVERLTAHIREQATFTAVGAAHLPGDDGMIKLLQKKGFTLTPVKATFTGMAASYKEKAVQEKWHTFTSAENAYAVDMPAEPFPYDIDSDKASKIMTMYMLPDLASGMVYYSAAITIPTQVKPSQQDELFRKMIDGMAQNKNSKLLKESKITFDTYPGREVEFFDGKEAAYMRCRIILRRNNVYMQMISGAREQLHNQEAVRFFNSFRLQDFAKSNWKEFTDPLAAFKINTPVSLTKQSREQDMENMEGIKSFQTIFSGTDQQKGIGYLSIVNDFSASYVILDDSLYLDGVMNLAAERGQGKLIEKRDINLQAFPGKAFTIQSPNLMYYCRTYLRGSRLYYLIVTTPPNEESLKSEAETFLNSFSFTSFKSPLWQAYTSDKRFAIKFPGEVINTTDTTHFMGNGFISSHYVSKDPHSSLSYFMSRSKYSDYYEAGNETEYFKQLVEASIEENDSLLSETPLTIDGAPAKELIIQKKGNHTVKRTKLILSGSNLYELMIYVPASSVFSAEVNHFFDGFTIDKAHVSGNIFSKKADKLFADLQSQNPDLHQEASDAISDFKFVQKDLSALYTALNKSYPDDTLQYGSTKLLLLNALSEISDATTLPFIKTFYNRLAESQSQLQIAALRVLTNMNAEESLTLFTDLILNKTPKIERNVPLFYNLGDSLAPSKVMFPRIMALYKYPAFTSSLYRFANSLCDSSLIKPQNILSFREPMVADGKTRFSKHMQASNEEDSYYSDAYTLEMLARLLGNFPEDPASQQLLTQMTTSPYDDLALEAAMALLKQNKPVSKKRLAEIAANKSLCLSLYDRLASLKRLDLFPSKYLNQEYFAQNSLISYLVYEDEGGEPDKVVLLESRETEIDGTKGRLYIYKFRYKPEPDEKESWYIGMSGLQPLNKKQVSTSGNYTYTRWELLEEKSINEHVEAILGSFE